MHKEVTHIPLSSADPSMFVSEDNNILQSELWENFQKKLGKKTITIRSDNYSFLAVIENTPIGKYLFVPYGPYLANYYQLRPALARLKKLAKREKAIFIRIEPTIFFSQKYLKGFGAIKSKDIDPAETWVLDLPEEKEKLLQLFPRRLRGYYNTHSKKGIEIIKSKNLSDIRYLVDLQKKTFQAKNIQPFSEKYLVKELEQEFSTLYLAKFQDKVIAAVLVFDDEETRYYMQAASDKNFAKLNANGILTIQAILDAWDKKLVAFDFWGIAPDDAPIDHPWAGFTAFKKMFAGEARYYSGTYDIPVKRLRYLFYRWLRKINLLIQKSKRES